MFKAMVVFSGVVGLLVGLGCSANEQEAYVDCVLGNYWKGSSELMYSRYQAETTPAISEHSQELLQGKKFCDPPPARFYEDFAELEECVADAKATIRAAYADYNSDDGRFQSFTTRERSAIEAHINGFASALCGKEDPW